MHYDILIMYVIECFVFLYTVLCALDLYQTINDNNVFSSTDRDLELTN